ncbi:nicotinate phosphoribosyltransferase, partial [Tremellales sp. Uapishka_1]
MASTITNVSSETEIPFSILDTDLYKLTMQNAVLQHFHDAVVVIKFTNRAPQMLFSRTSFDWIQEQVNRMSSLRLTSEERVALAKACPYFPQSYLDYLSEISLDPQSQVALKFLSKSTEGEIELGEIECVIEGVWRDCILYEVPVMSIISEGYFKYTDTDWKLDDIVSRRAKRKAHLLLSPPNGITPLAFSEFGTRRRRSFHVQDLVVKSLVEGWQEWKKGGGTGGGLVGTSNVYLALKYGIPPSGTIAHEWIMAVGATYGYKGANGRAMDMWEAVYPPSPTSSLHTMLTDTYTAAEFFSEMTANPERALRWNALRQDSGDPMTFARAAKKAWQDIGETSGKKRVIFSDGLTRYRAIDLQRQCDQLGILAAFGIGTSFTNDFVKVSDPTQKSEPLNIVIKLNRIDGKGCVKLSDDKGKYTGEPEEVQKVLEVLKISDKDVEKRAG